MDATRESQSRRTLFDEEESDEGKRPARATKQKTACSDKDEDTCGEEDVTQDFSCLQLESSSSSEGGLDEKGRSRPPTVAGTRKRTRTPSPPHKVIPKLKPNSDLFWSREFVDDWNDEHSPKKELFSSGPSKPLADSPKKCPRAPSPQKIAAAQARESRLLRQAFDAHKHSLATDFLVLLDTRLTSSRLSALTASTGGIKLVWSKTLNTTAGRANWKKESITTRPSKQEANKEGKKEVKHHASIELATKVLSTPERLFNTLAHEFCHLAVFMIDGVTTRPHGAEFKAWARRVNDEFGRHRCPFGKLVVGEVETRGKWEGGYAVEVTTRHGYEIEFRYVWVCDGPVSGVEGKDKGCGTEYKRHSKSVDPSRHRCGVCKGVLRQVKPAPRGQQEGGGGGNTSSADGKQPGTQGGMGTNKVKEKATKTSEYQAFVKEQMKVVKAQKPGLAFGEVMKEVAERWKVKKTKREREKKVTPMLSAETAGKLSTLLEAVIANEDDDGENSPDVFEDEPMMDVVDLTADH
ncbi:SprT-like family-domain-containing protein [Pseudoneurospora amorphoporcata]|uniref:SprT-like family-domain-containing protein n=1 Tax=Pseudoneurospora amorphoporcata TaxID=241081 RepID=A0AAN6NPJ4_9PEZI|nr:SprT-like family-domain-containing protein [Pseudoneurospora amorphoporcata]